jgi:hypothetical protein
MAHMVNDLRSLASILTNLAASRQIHPVSATLAQDRIAEPPDTSHSTLRHPFMPEPLPLHARTRPNPHHQPQGPRAGDGSGDVCSDESKAGPGRARRACTARQGLGAAGAALATRWPLEYSHEGTHANTRLTQATARRPATGSYTPVTQHNAAIQRVGGL